MPPATQGLPGQIMFVDIFHGDKVTDFAAARKFPLYGVVHKATQGVGPGAHDPLYHARRDMWLSQPSLAWTAGDGTVIQIPPLWGAYDFNTGDPVKDQVDNFLAIAQPDDRTLLCIDFEDNQKSEMTLAQLIEHCQRVYDATGQYEKIYSGNRIKEMIVHATDSQRSALSRHDFWLCQYGRNAVMVDADRKPLPWPTWWAWQRDADGLGPDSHGILGISPLGIDEDVFNGTPEDLAASWVHRS